MQKWEGKRLRRGLSIWVKGPTGLICCDRAVWSRRDLKLLLEIWGQKAGRVMLPERTRLASKAGGEVEECLGKPQVLTSDPALRWFLLDTNQFRNAWLNIASAQFYFSSPNELIQQWIRHRSFPAHNNKIHPKGFTLCRVPLMSTGAVSPCRQSSRVSTIIKPILRWRSWKLANFPPPPTKGGAWKVLPLTTTPHTDKNTRLLWGIPTRQPLWKAFWEHSLTLIKLGENGIAVICIFPVRQENACQPPQVIEEAFTDDLQEWGVTCVIQEISSIPSTVPLGPNFEPRSALLCGLGDGWGLRQPESTLRPLHVAPRPSLRRWVRILQGIRLYVQAPQ